jgi:hypothetical protein
MPAFNDRRQQMFRHLTGVSNNLSIILTPIIISSNVHAPISDNLAIWIFSVLYILGSVYSRFSTSTLNVHLCVAEILHRFTPSHRPAAKQIDITLLANNSTPLYSPSTFCMVTL